MLGREEHGQHVIDRRQLERTFIVIEQGDVAEVAIRIGDQLGKDVQQADPIGVLTRKESLGLEALRAVAPTVELAVAFRGSGRSARLADAARTG